MTYIYSYNPQVFDASFWVLGTLGLVDRSALSETLLNEKGSNNDLS